MKKNNLSINDAHATWRVLDKLRRTALTSVQDTSGGRTTQPANDTPYAAETAAT